MSYLNPPYPNNFQELCACYPVWYLDVFEMRQILKTEGKLLDGICASIEAIVGDNFILTADEATLRGWEETLGIRHSKPMTLDQRRAVVIAHFGGWGHIGEPEIKQIVYTFTKRDCDVSFDKGIIYIHARAEITDTVVSDDCFNILRTRIPAHLRIYTDFEVEFINTLYATSMAHQGDRYIIAPVPPEGQSAAGQVYAGTAAMQNSRYALDIKRQPGLTFSAKAYIAGALFAAAHVQIPIPPAQGREEETELHTGIGAAQSTALQIDLAPGASRCEAAGTTRTRTGLVENTHYTIISRR